MKLYLLRHGQSTSDVEDRYGGDYEDHLTELGISQSKDLAEKLADKGIDMIFTSPRIRARETAEIISMRLNCPLEVVEDLKERNAYGVLTGMVRSEAEERHPELVEHVKNYANTIEGAESYEHLTERVSACMEDLLSRPYGTVAILSHGGFIRCFLREVMKMPEVGSLGDCFVMEFEKTDSGIVKV